MTEADSVILECGKTLEELSLYLDAGRLPYDPTVETCPECLNALDMLSRAGDLSRRLIADDAVQLRPDGEGWFEEVLASIRFDLRPGRSIPIAHPDPRVELTVTEVAVKALIRSAGDTVPGAMIGRTSIIGDAELAGAPVRIEVTASVAFGVQIPTAAQDIRRAIGRAVAQHTELAVTAIDVTIDDLHRIPIEGRS